MTGLLSCIFRTNIGLRWMMTVVSFSVQGVSVRADESSGNPALSGYRKFSELEAELSSLANSSLADLQSLGKTLHGRDIWLLTISSDPSKTKPAILVVGNVEASHVLGSEIALRIAKQLVEKGAGEERVRLLLDRYTVYVIPSPSPDATEKNFQSGLRGIDGNSLRTDDDRDFEVGEDAPADLNGDGYISMLRIEDDLGTHRVHPEDPRVMIAIDSKKNERGTHRIVSEARDLDGDEKRGEDAADGVDFNKNFTFNYNYFGIGAGPHQVSENETRAIADFCFSHPNIAAVLSFSNQDNLFHPWKPSSSGDAQRIKSSLQAQDAPYSDYLSDKFKEFHGGKEPPAASTSPGAFVDWAYYHYGRWSFASRGWWIPATKKAESEAEEAKPESSEPKKKTSEEKRGQDEINALRWFASEGINGFVDWKPIEHPDFPGKKVEVGGFKPFLKSQPPEKVIEAVVKPHVDFIVELAEQFPKVEIREFTAKQLSNGYVEVEADIVNTGFMPTMSEMGRINGESYPIVVEADFPNGTKWIQGEQKILVSKLNGQGGKRTLKWLVRVPKSSGETSKLSIKAASPTTQPASATIELKP